MSAGTEVLCSAARPHKWLWSHLRGDYYCFHCDVLQKQLERLGHRVAAMTAPTPTMPHAHALFEEAEKTISGPRRGDYGDAAESFRRIALTWSAVLGMTVTPQQVALCMVGMKICREANAHKHDSLVDICGYTGLLAEMEAATPHP